MKVDIRTMEGLLRGKCLPANMLVNESLAEYLVRQFDALHERAEAAERERDELRLRDCHQCGEILQLAGALNKAESELARRDAAVVEPVSWPDMPFSFEELEGMHGKTFANGYVCGWARKCESVTMKGRLYTAAPPAVLPPVANERDAFNNWNNDDNLPIAGVPAKNAAWLAWQARAALGAQPQKPVFMPKSERINNGYYFDMDDIFVALDAAGVKYKVVK